MEDIVEQIVQLCARGERAALASLVWSSGSVPMSESAKMLVLTDGKLLGTIGGGCLEAEVLDAGRDVLETGTSRLIRYTMTEKQAGESGLNCGGTVRIYTELIDPERAGDVYAEVHRRRQERQGCALATPLSNRSSGRLLLLADGGRLGTLGCAAADDQVAGQLDGIVEKNRGQVVELDLEDSQARALGFAVGTAAEVFIEPFLPAPNLFVFGGGHVGAQIGKLAKNVGFRVVIIDDRPLFANPQRHPQADDWVVEEMDQVFDSIEIDAQSYIVAVTRGHQHDEQVIERAIRTPARYIGMLGSERKKLLMWKRIAERGGDRKQLDQIFAPIGINIGADTPEEIAVSVVAELIRVRRGVKKPWKTKLAGFDA